MSDLWDLKFKILDKLDRKREAIEAAQEGLRNVPSEAALLLDVAKASMDLGEYDVAQKHAELAARVAPTTAHQILANIYAHKGDLSGAEKEAKASLQSSTDPTAPLMQLAGVEKQRGNLDAALQYLDRAEQHEQGHVIASHQGLHLARGDILARLGRNEEAEQEFRVEITNFPKTPDAYASLVLLLATQQRLDEATKLIFDLMRVAPTEQAYTAVSETLKAIGDERGSAYWAYQGLQKFPRNEELRSLSRPGKKAAGTN